MLLTNSLGDYVEFDTHEYQYEGGTSIIYEVDESTMLKVHILLNNEISLSPLNTTVFDLLKTIKHNNFINLIERYHRVPKTSENVEAYTYERIKGDIYNILFMRTDFVMNEFRAIQGLYKIFNEEGVIVSDAHADNSVVLWDRIVIIDPDLFYQYHGKKEILMARNKCTFVDFMESYFDKTLCDKEKTNELFDGLSKETDPVKSLDLRLKGYKFPYDYFLNKK